MEYDWTYCADALAFVQSPGTTAETPRASHGCKPNSDVGVPKNMDMPCPDIGCADSVTLGPGKPEATALLCLSRRWYW